MESIMDCFKKMITGMCLIVLLSPALHADELKVNLGMKAWYSSWEIDGSGGESEESDFSVMVGPSMQLVYGKIFGGMSVMTAVPEYEFSTFDWGRTDIDLLMGLFVHPRISLVGGWKYLRGSTDESNSHSAYGPAFGASFNYPVLNQRATLYLNSVLLLLKGDLKSQNLVNGTTVETDFDLWGYSFEGGVAFALLEKVTLNVGYKYQDIRWQNAANDIVAGVTLGMTYSF